MGASCCLNRQEVTKLDTDPPANFQEAVPAIPSVEAACVSQCQNELGSSLVWCSRQQTLYWLDLSKQDIWSFEPKTKEACHQAVDLGWQGGCLALRKDAGFVICSALGVGLLDACERLQSNGPKLSPRIVSHPIEESGLDSDVVRLAAGRVDPAGKLLVGTYHTKYTDFVDSVGQAMLDKLPDQKDPRGSVYRISLTTSYLWAAKGHLEELSGLGKVSHTNGIAFSPGATEHLMYCVDTPTQQVRSFKYGNTLSSASNVTEPFLHKGIPGGACVDSEGGYWVCETGSSRVSRIKDGQVTMFVTVATPMVESCTFGGPDLGTLYIITGTQKDGEPSELSGGLFACDTTGFTGIKEFYFDG